MSKIKIVALLAIASLGVVGVGAHGQTLDTLIMKQRDSLIEEANKKAALAKGAPSAGAAPQQLQISQVPLQINNLPALPSLGLPGESSAGQAPPVRPITKAIFKIEDAKFVAVYGVGDNLTAEIAYNGAVATVVKYAPVIDGWSAKQITSNFVVLTKMGPKGSVLTHVLKYNEGSAVVSTQQVLPVAKKLKKAAFTKQKNSEPKTVAVSANAAPAVQPTVLAAASK